MRPLHPAKLLPHVQLVPLFDLALDLPIFGVEDGSSMPRCFVARGLYVIVRFVIVAA